jgi:hypothetical protein
MPFQVFDHPGLFVNVVPPQVMQLNGVPFNKGGVVGSASWGPVNAPTAFANAQAGAQAFGNANARKYDMMTVVTAAQLQGNAGSFVGVRVTDGTDVAASGSIGNNGTLAFWTALANAINFGALVSRGPSNTVVATATGNGLTLAAKYTGSLGNQINITLGNGSQAGSYRLTVGLPNQQPEVFDNLGAPQAAAVAATGNVAFTQNPSATQTLTLNGTPVTFVASGATGNQVNIGTTLSATLASLFALLQGSSDTQLVKFTYSLAGTTLGLTAATAGTGGNALTVATTVTGATASGATLTGGAAAMTAPTITTTATLAGGTDGATAITKAILLGSDVAPRTGMYALRNQGCSVAVLADLDDPTSYSVQDTFAGSERLCLCVTGPAGDSIANAVANKQANFIDTVNLKVLLGDWVTFNDTVNNSQRKISPQGFWLGARLNLGPHQSTLNKPLYGIVATEKTAGNQVYAGSDLATLYANGIDVLTNPAPGGAYFAAVTGRNASSNPATRGENYTFMTNYLVRTLNSGMGAFVGQLQSLRSDDITRRQAKATIDAFLANLADRNVRNPPMIDDFQTVLDSSNNAAGTIAAGFMFAYVKVLYMSVVEFFAISLEGGQSVQINRTGSVTVDQTGSGQYAALNSSFLSPSGF